jgi:hypothetical protein
VWVRVAARSNLRWERHWSRRFDPTPVFLTQKEKGPRDGGP